MPLRLLSKGKLARRARTTAFEAAVASRDAARPAVTPAMLATGPLDGAAPRPPSSAPLARPQSSAPSASAASERQRPTSLLGAASRTAPAPRCSPSPSPSRYCPRLCYCTMIFSGGCLLHSMHGCSKRAWALQAGCPPRAWQKVRQLRHSPPLMKPGCQVLNSAR